ncbi:MAG: general secretion pathway protein GspC [Alteromonadaceae bacterium]|nr:general secretion pathway protein GspC [Alteromonadaceae bacterium]
MPIINRRIPLLLAMLALVAMLVATGWQGYSFWQAVKNTSMVSTGTPAPPPGQLKDDTPNLNFRTLNLFGNASSVTGSGSQPETENLPETNLRLTLRGALAGDGEFPGSALVEDQSGNTEAYLVGDTLPGNAQLRTVLPERVIIERNGALENLFFPDTDESRGLELEASNQDGPGSSQQQQTSNDGALSARPSPDDQARREEVRERLQQLRQRLQDNR